MLELNYGDNYVKVDENPRVQGSLIGGIFAGSWEMLDDCFGITADTIDDWCQFNGYHYSVKKFGPEDELLNSLYKLRNELKRSARMDSANNTYFDDGGDEGYEYAETELSKIIDVYEKATN